jgi:hypothetical protein
MSAMAPLSSRGRTGSHAFEVFISPYNYYPTDQVWTCGKLVET